MKLLNVINPAYWVNKIIDKRIQHYGKGVGTEMKYNPLLTSMKSNATDKHMTRRILENSVWYSGIEQDIAYFYQTEAPNFYRSNQASESMNYFWANKDWEFRKIHSGFPQLISEKMVDLIIGNGYEFKIEGDNEAELQEEFDELLKENMIDTLLCKSIETESWSGGTSWKLSFNPMISEYPIIEMWQPENYTSKVVSGRVVEDIFYSYYNKGNNKYRLSQIYGVDKKKGAYIDYALDELTYSTQGQSKEAKWISCALTELEQTKDLKRLDFIGYFKRLSLYKPNKLPNSEFRYSTLGESDYAGSYGAFDAIDEIISTWIQEFRDGKLNRYFPEEYVIKNKSGQVAMPSSFQKDHTLYADSPSENVDKQKILYEQGDIRTEKHIESYKIWVQQALNNSGLSPLTVGITGLESIDASAESQQEREKVSIRTRNKKIGLWKEYLTTILPIAFDLHLMMKRARENDEEILVGKLPEYEVKVSFNDYIIKSKRDRTNEVTEGFNVTWDILEGVRYVHDEKTEREQLAISARIKLDNGIQTISQAELSALEQENIDNNEMLAEDGVNILTVNENQENEVGTGIEENANTPPNEDQV